MELQCLLSDETTDELSIPDQHPPKSRSAQPKKEEASKNKKKLNGSLKSTEELAAEIVLAKTVSKDYYRSELYQQIMKLPHLKSHLILVRVSKKL